MAGPVSVANLGANATEVIINPQSANPSVNYASTIAYFKGIDFSAGAGGEGTVNIQTQVNGSWATQTTYSVAANNNDSVYIPGDMGVRLKDGLRVTTDANIDNAQIYYT